MRTLGKCFSGFSDEGGSVLTEEHGPLSHKEWVPERQLTGLKGRILILMFSTTSLSIKSLVMLKLL